MTLTKEHIDYDLFVDPKPLTKAEKKRISDFIKADKEKRKSLSKKNATTLVNV